MIEIDEATVQRPLAYIYMTDHSDEKRKCNGGDIFVLINTNNFLYDINKP